MSQAIPILKNNFHFSASKPRDSRVVFLSFLGLKTRFCGILFLYETARFSGLARTVGTVCAGISEGLAHVDLAAYGGPVLRMKPGAGFGDFSHPTTRLALSLMSPMAREHQVIDIGCGSGILSVAAALLGSARVVGIDIESEALQHSEENARLNGVEDRVTFTAQIDSLDKNNAYLIVMNMILSEQKIAWESLPLLHDLKATIVISGILTQDREIYLNLTKEWNWTLLRESQEGEWSGFTFLQINNHL